ncbi:MAG: response regulator [Campylobacterota bacterium]|nr:response regulator [Campylobacterota bacterium]
MKRVLIVDDSKFSRKATRKVLESMGYEIIGEAVDGLDGVEKFKELAPYLVVTDLEMPNLDGIGMIKEIHQHSDQAKIVVVTSIVNSHVVQEAIKLKASIIKKPIKEERLANAVKLLDR